MVISYISERVSFRYKQLLRTSRGRQDEDTEASTEDSEQDEESSDGSITISEAG